MLFGAQKPVLWKAPAWLYRKAKRREVSLLNASPARRGCVRQAYNTRDTVSEVANIRGIPIQLIDTAGMREAVDPLERIGVERARGALADADIALAVIDGSMPLAPEDLEIVMSTPEHRTAVVISKSDLPEAFAGEDVGGRVGNRRVLRVSALTGNGIDQLEAEIEALAVAREVDFGETAQSFGARRADCLGRAANALDEVARATGEGAA